MPEGHRHSLNVKRPSLLTEKALGVTAATKGARRCDRLLSECKERFGMLCLGMGVAQSPDRSGGITRHGPARD